MRSRLSLLLWLFGLLFPLAWFRYISTTYRQAFDAIFGPEWMHILMHTGLYAGLAIILVAAINSRLNARVAVTVLLTILIVGILQEGIQWLSTPGNAFLTTPALKRAAFDLGIDLLGGTLGLSVLYTYQAWKHRPPKPYKSG